MAEKRTSFEKKENRSESRGQRLGEKNASNFDFNPWLQDRIKVQAQIDEKNKFFDKNIGDGSAAPETTGLKHMPPQTIPEGLKIIKQARELLGTMWGVDGQNVLSFHSSASGATESIVSAMAHRKDKSRKILVTHFGAFSDRTRRQIKSLEIPHEVIRVDYGRTPTLNEITSKITGNTAGIALPHLETGTAQEVDLPKFINGIAKFCKTKGYAVPIIAIDATSSRGTIDLGAPNFKNLPLVIYHSTHKKTGSILMTHIIANDEGFERMIGNRLDFHAKQMKVPYYFDLAREASHQSPQKFYETVKGITGWKGKTLDSRLKGLGYNVTPNVDFGRAHFTQEISGFYFTASKLLKRQMEAAVITGVKTKEGLQKATDAVENIKRTVITKFRNTLLKKLGFELYGNNRSIMLNAYVPPEGISAAELKEFVRKKQGIVFGLGYGGVRPEDWSSNVHPRVKTANDIFRIQDYLSMHSFDDLMDHSKRQVYGTRDLLRKKNKPIPNGFEQFVFRQEELARKELNRRLKSLKIKG